MWCDFHGDKIQLSKEEFKVIFIENATKNNPIRLWRSNGWYIILETQNPGGNKGSNYSIYDLERVLNDEREKYLPLLKERLKKMVNYDGSNKRKEL